MKRIYMVLPDCEQDSKNTFPEKQLKTIRAKRLRIASKLLGSFQISFFPVEQPVNAIVQQRCSLI